MFGNYPGIAVLQGGEDVKQSNMNIEAATVVWSFGLPFKRNIACPVR